MKNSLENIRLLNQTNIPFWSEGNFSMHELLQHLLEQTGAASVRISSFSISESALRSFVYMSEKGLIKSLSCLFDLTVKQHRLSLLFFASNVTTSISLTKCHAKLILIENEQCKVAVIGSANLNVNDKKEVGIISTEDAIFSMFSKKYDEWFNDALTIEKDGF